MNKDNKVFISKTISIDPIILDFTDGVRQFSITYDIRTSDGSELPSEITPSSIFGKTQNIVNEHGSYSFDILIPFGYTAEVLRYDDNSDIPIKLTGKREDIDDESIRSQYVVNNGFPLGTEPVYTSIDTVDLNAGPEEYRRDATFIEDNVINDKLIIVELSKRTDPVYYDMHFALNRNNLSGRGSTGSSLNAPGGNLWPNIITEDNWGWNSNNGCFKDDPRKLSGNLLTLYEKHWIYDEETNSYSLDWIFQTNSGDMILNSFGINRVVFDIPYISEETWEGNTKLSGDGEGAPGTFTEAVVNDATVRLRKVRSFNKNTQQVYYLTIQNARCNMNVTAGNLMQAGSGSPEITYSKIQGISSDGVSKNTFQIYYQNDWIEHKIGDLTTIADLGQFNGDPNIYFAHFKFKLLPGYENPTFVITNLLKDIITDSNKSNSGIFDNTKYIDWDNIESNLDNGKMKQNYLYGPDSDEYYYFRIYNLPSAGNILFQADIIATSLKHIIRYMVGYSYDKITNIPGEFRNNLFIPATPDNMPTFDPKRNPWDEFRNKLDYIDDRRIERYDDNNGKFYDIVTNPNIVIVNNIPVDIEDKKVFQKWIIVDGNENPIIKDGNTIDIYPNTALRLEEYVQYMNILDTELGGLENNYFVLRLKSVWTDKD